MSKLALLLLLSAFGLECGTNVPASNIPATISPMPTPTESNPPDDVLIPWEQTIGTTSYRWDGKDLHTKISQAKEIPLFSRAARQYHRSFKNGGGRCFLSNYFSPASVVGDLVSYEHESGFICGTASGEWRYATVDVSNATRFLDLRNFFTEDELLLALLANAQLASDIQKSIGEKKLDVVPTTMKQLSGFLTKHDYQLFNGSSYFEPDYLTRFAFHHLEGERICIRVSATSTSTAGRANHEYLEIYLPIPNKLHDRVRKAASGEQGFLMKDSQAKVGTACATFESKF